ncbi:hypothetical protein RhiirA1_477505 [Rhizophagus irregularis]|uniref:Uncharacterized protein n=1 Tax=Rhizophagus irregularis TaxID=588596 RepID=A0A2N0QTL7_9GLOM|nr:hypothetical protein RhiirA1_477505 [Rhizophagus irregularis]
MSIDIVHRWAKQVIKNHKNEDYYDNELFEDPLLIIEWFIGNKIKKSTTYQNNSCYYRQSLSNALSVLVSNKWSRHER